MDPLSGTGKAIAAWLDDVAKVDSRSVDSLQDNARVSRDAIGIIFFHGLRAYILRPEVLLSEMLSRHFGQRGQ